MSHEGGDEKLIRDALPEQIRAQGRGYHLRQVSDEEVVPFVRRKVLEEAAEVHDALLRLGPEAVTLELADLLEVMHRVAAISGIPWADVEAMRGQRARERGAFDANWLLRHPITPYRVYGGPQRPFLAPLIQHLGTCSRASLAVSFTMNSGVALVEAPLRDALARGAVIRLLTSDYLDVTDPEALERLLALPGNLDLRLYREAGRSFHAKAYMFEEPDGKRTAYIGSSNLSASALRDGIEWNYAARDTDDGWSVSDLFRRFEGLFGSMYTVKVTPEAIAAYRERRRPRTFADVDADALQGAGQDQGAGWEPDNLVATLAEAGGRYEVTPNGRHDAAATLSRPSVPPTPNDAQREALAELVALRADGEARGLVVAATGIGKTYLAAFDSLPFGRVLFLAHRDELLAQAQRTFGQVRPEARSGVIGGGGFEADADLVFASVATLGRAEHLAKFAPDYFDYIVVDEFHHAAAASYRRVNDHFRPQFLLGLTATPYRGDNHDVFALCNGNVAYRVTLLEAIAFGWLAPFRYFGLHDDTDFAAIPWRNGAYELAALEIAVATQARMAAAIQAFQQHPSTAALGFCVSIRHAEAAARVFNAAGIPALAVHSGAGATPRAEALAALRTGAVRILFTVDLFNEGVDIPEVDLVLFLRPTESITVFLQQLGRGLRLHPGKPFLTVIDFIGNYKKAHYKLPALLGKLESEPDEAAIRDDLKRLAAGELPLPPGVAFDFAPEAIDVMRVLAQRTEPRRARLTSAYREVEAALGRRPTLAEMALHSTLDADEYRKEFGSWFNFLEGIGALLPDERDENVVKFLTTLEGIGLKKSYMMVVLRAFVQHGGMDAPVLWRDMAVDFKQFYAESPLHARDLADTPIADIARTDLKVVRGYMRKNPITAWIGGFGKKGDSWFAVQGDLFAYVGPQPSHPQAFAQAVLERVEYRLARYFRVRYERQSALPQSELAGSPA